ncbi:hypothetical protein T484DRAFT_1917497 [Baffinella frigidus]|nr:hypothetical protein T484DRAFT_1917497 [Cryptophyta sp. CCMP2293]
MPNGSNQSWDGFSNGGFGLADAQDASLGFTEVSENGVPNNRAELHATAFAASNGIKDPLSSPIFSMGPYVDNWSSEPALAFQGQDALASQCALQQGAGVSFALPMQGDQPHLHMLLSSPVIGAGALSGLASGAGEDKGEVSSLLHILGADLYGALDDEGTRSLPFPPPVKSLLTSALSAGMIERRKLVALRRHSLSQCSGSREQAQGQRWRFSAPD